MGDTLNRSPSTRHLGAFKTRKASGEKNQKSESYQHQQLSRFMTGALGLTAQNNPNWRTRPKTEGSSATNESLSERKKRARRGQSSSVFSSDEMRCHDSSVQFGILSNANREAKAMMEMRDRTTFTSNFFQISVDLDYSEDEGFYEVYKHIDLGPLREDDGPLNLFELGLPRDGDSHPLVKVQHLNKEAVMHFGHSGNEQKEQLRIALQAGAVTPRKGPSSSSCRSFSDSHSAPAIGVQQTSESTEAMDKGFQRILEKLTRSTGQTRNIDVDNKTESTTETSTFRYPIQGAGRRVDTASEPCDGFNYGQIKSHKKEDTNDSGVCMEDHGKFKSLNPRAREFLSRDEFPTLKFREDSAISGCSEPDFQPFSRMPLASKTEKPQAPLGSHLVATNTTMQLGFGYGPVPPIPLDGLLSGGLLPITTDQLQCFGPAPTLTPLPTLTTQPVLQPIAGNILSLPPTPILNTVFPLAGPVNPCLVAPACPLPVAGAASRPPAVPKPRRPDPSDQQAYEAWIEWRKANEPGYALECKLRQQRRAQRSMMDKPRVKLGKKTEATTLA
ncbi:hypothetical protein PT974_11380 [Cladobotryum mycophilum]|uniref:Uncharacterized protein n=1 Tax=Cladobotryum mycophilum TaxID=491253 RepID=A0ABR0S621_9HYPO